MKKYLFISLLATISISFTSCDDENDVDTTKPVIELDEPEDGDEFLIGGDMHFEGDFSDDKMLGSYMVEIHNNFDGHGHNKTLKATDTDTEAFFFKKTYDLSGLRNTHVHHHDIKIPENATPGAYHLMVYCTDAAGNQSLIARSIILSHDAAPHEHDHDDDDED